MEISRSAGVLNRRERTKWDLSRFRRVQYPVSEAQNRAMFDAIAPRYDLLNRVVSLRLDVRWRRALARALRPRAAGLYLDVGTGTGDVAREVLRGEPAARVLGVDPAAGMVGIGRRKVPRAGFGLASGQSLPVRSGVVDGVASAFVLRNLADVDAYFREAARVLRPGGVLANLEIGRAEGRVFGPLYRLYFYGLVPRVGRALSGNPRAYSYLADSVKVVPPPENFAARMTAAGFRDVAIRRFSKGAVALVSGVR